MIAAILRIVLLLLPLVVLLLWLRYRMRTNRTEDELEQERAMLRKVVITLLIVGAAAGIALKFADTNTGDARTKYIPPHTENGQVVPGRFVPVDEAADEPETAPKETSPESDEPREQDPS